MSARRYSLAGDKKRSAGFPTRRATRTADDSAARSSAPANGWQLRIDLMSCQAPILEIMLRQKCTPAGLAAVSLYCTAGACSDKPAFQANTHNLTATEKTAHYADSDSGQ